ncbi:MAG: IS1595 family transposase [Erysipelotrichaceae bacterium]|nr:IS1595 family transposase [Erysipelotrichaceae bacterium]
MSNQFKHGVHWGHSLRNLSWDKSDHKTPSQELISSTVHEWYDAKHRKTSDEEIKLINSTLVNHCPYCGSPYVIRSGFKDGIQRYFCKDCHHYFNPLTGTIFEDRKIPVSEWVEYLLHLFEFHSITSSARDNRNAYSTGKYWLIKVFEVLKHYQDDIILQGTIVLDETFFTKIESQKQLKPDGKEYRGISRNKLCVGCAKDDSGKIVLLCENTSKPSLKSSWNTFCTHIEEGSHLIHDGEKSHSVLIDKLHLTSEVYDADEIKKLKDEDNPLDSINEIHSLAKRFMAAHGGYNRENLQDFMNLICFILNEPYDRYEKVDLFINMALNSPIRVKYRDVISKKEAE